MPQKTRPPNPKVEALQKEGCLNPHPERVRDPLFHDADFFDARDLVQVKYEMVRRVSVDGQAATHSAAAFGFSRPSFYQARLAVEQGGLAALVPRRRGPRGGHKLTPEVVDFLLEQRQADPFLSSQELAHRVLSRFGRTAHPRSIERALSRREKKRP